MTPRLERTLPLVALLTGCAVGPRYVKPELPQRPAWATGATGTSLSASDEALLTRWWTELDDPILVDLVERAVVSNPDLLQARARVREARARRGAAVADLAPAVTGSASVARTRSRAASGASATTTDLFQAGLDASWEIDLFGGARRAAEAAKATEEAAIEDEWDVRVSLAAEVALAYLGMRTTAARLEVGRQSLAALQETADLTRWRAEAGLVTQLDAEQARASLEQERAAIPSLEREVVKDRNALATLLGLEPGALDTELETPRPIPVVKREVAVGVPAEVLRRRPDVRRAERELAAETAKVGAARAARFPSLTLSGSIGLESLRASGLLGPGAVISSIGAGLLAPIFDAGRLSRTVEVQEAIRDQSLLAYRRAVLTALQDVEDALVAFDREQARRGALAEAAEAAERAASLARDQYQAGLVTFIAVLDAERTHLSLRDSLATSQGEVGADLVRLYKALGGGWSPAIVASQERR